LAPQYLVVSEWIEFHHYHPASDSRFQVGYFYPESSTVTVGKL
jgi:hypothetical protein